MLAVDDTVNITYNTCGNYSWLKNSSHGIALGQQNVPSANALIEIPLKDQSKVDAVTRYELKQVPLFLIHAFESVTKEAALKTVGLFRKEANHTKVNVDLDAIFTCKMGLPSDLGTVDVSVLIKRFFRTLRKPLISNSALEKKLIKLATKDFSEITREEFCSLFVPNSPHEKPALEASHLGTLGYLMLHLNKVSSYEHLHKMNPRSLATVFAPNLFPQPDDSNAKLKKGKPDDVIFGQKKINDARVRCTEMLIVMGNWIGQPVTPYWSSENRSRSSSATAPVRKYLSSCARVLPLKESLNEKKLKNTNLKDSKSSNRRSSSSFGVFFFGGRKESSKAPPQRRQTLVLLDHRSSPAMMSMPEGRTEEIQESAPSPPSATRLSRSEQHRRSRVATPVNTNRADLLKLPKSKPVRRLTDVSNTHALNRSSIVRAETYNGPYKAYRDPTISLLGSDMFDESCRKQKQPSGRRRNTTPIKLTGGLRRDAPNTVKTGLPLPKRRATVVLRKERDDSSEASFKRRSLNNDEKQDVPPSSLSLEQAILDSSALLEQKGYESRQRRTKLRSGKTLTPFSNSPDFVHATKSPERESVSNSMVSSSHEFGSAIVGPSQIVDVFMMGNSPSTSSHMPMDLDMTPLEMKDLDATISLSEDKEPLQSPRITAKMSSPIFRVPTLPVPRPVPLITQRSLDSQLSTTLVSMNDPAPVNPRIVSRYPSGRCQMKPPLAPKPVGKSASSKSTVVPDKLVERISIDDNDFSFSNDMKNQILSCNDYTEFHAPGSLSGMRPSVAHIQANNPGRVKGMVQHINSINHEPRSGRSSAMSSRSSLGDRNDFSCDYGGGRLSGPPASHNLTTRLTPRHSYPSPLKK